MVADARLHDRIKERLLERGFEGRDIDSIRIKRNPLVNLRTRLTEQAWIKMLPSLESILSEVQHARRVQTRYMRTYTFDCFYRRLLACMIPMQTLCLPNAQNALGFPVVQDAIQNDLDANVNSSSVFEERIPALLAAMATWMESKKRDLLKQLPKDLFYDEGEMIPLKTEDVSYDISLHPRTYMTKSALDDATSVFVQSDKQGALIGIEITQSWKAPQVALAFSQRGSNTAAQLLHILHQSGRLATLRATAVDLDRMDDLYFTCAHCDRPTDKLGSNGKLLWTWRACVGYS